MDAPQLRLTIGQQVARVADGSESGPLPTPQAALVEPQAAAATEQPERPGTRLQEGLGVLPADGAAYYASTELTRPPRPVTPVVLETPKTLPIVASGTLVITLWISPQGDVVNINVDESQLPSIISRSAVDAFRQARFTPGELNGRSVGAVITIEVAYDDSRMADLPQ